MAKRIGKTKASSAASRDIAEIMAAELMIILGAISRDIAALEAQANEQMKAIADDFNARLTPLRAEQAIRDKELIGLMKKNKGILFDGTDVVNLLPGSLIRNMADHVSIPRDALQACKDNQFTDVIKTVESLDREAIEKWTDNQLSLIGAERKPKEEFKYNLKKDESQEDKDGSEILPG